MDDNILFSCMVIYIRSRYGRFIGNKVIFCVLELFENLYKKEKFLYKRWSCPTLKTEKKSIKYTKYTKMRQHKQKSKRQKDFMVKKTKSYPHKSTQKCVKKAIKPSYTQSYTHYALKCG